MRHQHSFAQQAVPDWDTFIEIAKLTGFTVRATGGLTLTHEIDGSHEDFDAILELATKQGQPR